MDYPTKLFTCDLCGGRYADSDGGCACCDDRFYCPECGAIQAADAPTFAKLRRAEDGRTDGRLVCAACARCHGCDRAVGTVIDEHGSWLCAACAAEEL